LVKETQKKSGLAGWVLAIVKAMRTSGVEVEPVFDAIGMDPELLQGGYSRYSQEQISELWRQAIKRTDSDFGLRVAREVRPSTFHVVGYAMNCSATLSRALHRFSFYCRLISDAATATIIERGEEVVLDIKLDTGGAPPIYQTVDTILASVLAFLRWIVEEDIIPISVSIDHPREDYDKRLEDFFGCPVEYEAGRNAIVFSKIDMEKSIPVADEELASMLDNVANRYLDARMEGRFAVRVRDVLETQLPTGNVGKTRISQILNLTERTLLRRLKDEGTTFSDQLYRVRLAKAFSLLRKPEMTIREIAYALGFSDEGTFSRAFKRWTGRRPSVVSNMNSDEFEMITKTLKIEGDYH
jgi:AraC-like DNA-binding protein